MLRFLQYMQSVGQNERSKQQEKRSRQSHAMMLKSMDQYNEVANYMRDPRASQTLGAGRLAKFQDVAFANLFGEDGLYLGFFDGRPIYYNGDRHGLSYGRTRSGKGRDIILPVLGTMENNSLIVTDIKDGENAYSTAEWRSQELGHNCIALNPNNIAGVPSFRLNPCQTMIDVARKGHELEGEDEQFIELFLPMTEKQKQADNAWALEGAREILRIRVKYLAYFRPSKCNPAELWHMVHGSADKIRAQYQEMIDCGDLSIAGTAEGYLSKFEHNERQYGGYQTGLNRAVRPYAPNSVFARETSTSDFDPADLKRQHTTVYVMLPTEKIEVGSQWLTLMVSTMMDRIAAATGTIRTTVILDELANLPYMPVIPKALKLYAGLGVRMWGFCQGRHSLIDAGYTKETIREFEDQAGFLQLWEVEDTDLLKDIEIWSGKKGVVTRSANMGGGGGFNAAFAISESARAVLQAEDIRAIGEGQQLLKVAGCPYLINALRAPWFEMLEFATNFRDPREITNGASDWRPRQQKRTLALPAPAPKKPDKVEPTAEEKMLFLLDELDAKDQRLAEMQEQLNRRHEILDVLRDALSTKGDKESDNG